MHTHALRTVSAIAVMSLTLIAQQSSTPKAAAAPAGSDEKGPFSHLDFRSVGPGSGGRVDSVAGVAGDPRTFYLGAAAGGIFKSEDGGQGWKPVFVHEAVSSIGALAVAPSDPNVVWAGTGEANVRGDISFGRGVYRSTDAGKTWQHLGLDDTDAIAEIAVDPRDPDRAFVAALGHVFGPNSERGVFRTTDGGKTWQKVLYKDENTGASSVALDAGNPRIVFAGLWQVRRQPWHLEDGGPGSGLYRSTDGGTTWKQLVGRGLPEGVMGKIAVAVAPSDSKRVYALIESEKGLLWRSDDGGDSWTLVNSSHAIDQRPWYYTYVVVDPNNENVVYCPSVSLMKSIDGGKTFTRVSESHGDNHALWIDPRDSRRLLLGDDGGAHASLDAGATWHDAHIPITQFYHVNLDNRVPYYICGEEQDLGSACGPSNNLGGAGIPRWDWYDVGGGESGFAVPDPVDPDIVYANSYEGELTRYDRRTRQAVAINVWPQDTIGAPASLLKYRFQWTAPIAISPHDHRVVYVGANVLFKTDDGGFTWRQISPDLTRDDKSKQGSSGGPISGDNTSVEYYDTIFAVAESPVTAGQIWVGTDDGLVQLTRDGGAHWTKVTPAAMPPWCAVDTVEPSRRAAGTAYVAVDCHKLGDDRPYAFATTDFGTHWRAINAGLPDWSYVHVVREDAVRSGLLYLGTETGLYLSYDDGETWQPFQNNLPTTPVHDLAIQTTFNDLVVGTHGRSFWIFDDLGPVQQMTPQVAAEPAHLFTPRPAYRFALTGDYAPSDGKLEANPPYGALISYYLKNRPTTPIKVTILDAGGRIVRTFASEPTKKPNAGGTDKGAGAGQSGEEENPSQPPKPTVAPAEAGVNRLAWDLRYERPRLVKGVVLWNGAGRNGPLALPGIYTVRLEAAGQTLEQRLEVKPDPRFGNLDLRPQFQLAQRLSGDVNRIAMIANSMDALRDQLKNLRKEWAGQARYKQLSDNAVVLTNKIAAVEGELLDRRFKEGEDVLRYPVRAYNQVSSLMGFVEQGDRPVPQRAFMLADELEKTISHAQSEFDSIERKDIPQLNAQAHAAGVGVLMMRPGTPTEAVHAPAR